MKKYFSIVLSLLVMACATVCFATDSFQMTYEAKHFTEGMKNDQALTETFNTPNGSLKFQMRKLWQLSSDNKLHLIVWLDDKKIADEYFSKVDYGYTFRVIKNTNNSEQFYMLESSERAYLFGYSPTAQKFEVYIDSINYAHAPGSYPYIVALKNGDLVLSFEQQNANNPIRARYRFN